MAQARQIAHDILVMCSRVEADAMIVKFFEKHDFPQNAAGALLVEFREFRAARDDQSVEHDHRIPPRADKWNDEPQP